MSSYKAPIGRSFYEIPYTSQEDLLLLREICFEANKVVNSVLSSGADVTNELALVLALINMIYENRSSSTVSNSEYKYTSDSVVSIITHLHNKLLEVEHVG